jgi:hypothetical protein
MRTLRIFLGTAFIFLILSLMQGDRLKAQTHQHGATAAKPPASQALSQLAPQTIRKIGPQLAKNFTFQPFAPPMPDHVWMKADDKTITFLHFAKPVNQPNNQLIFIGDGIRGRFCADNQPDQGKTGYVHFHSLKAAPGHEHNEMMAMGHGGQPGQEGYWLRHIAVAEFDMMGQHFKPGLAMDFMPTPPPKCG